MKVNSIITIPEAIQASQNVPIDISLIFKNKSSDGSRGESFHLMQTSTVQLGSNRSLFQEDICSLKF